MDNKFDEEDECIIISSKEEHIYADMDPTIAQDPRIIYNLLAIERSTMPQCDYFRHLQSDIQPFMRKVVTTWMLEVILFLSPYTFVLVCFE